MPISKKIKRFIMRKLIDRDMKNHRKYSQKASDCEMLSDIYFESAVSLASEYNKEGDPNDKYGKVYIFRS